MVRTKNTPVTLHRRKKILKQIKGSLGPNTFKVAKERRAKALRNAFIGRKQRKRDFRKLWILRLNACLKNKYGIRYSKFIHLLALAQIKLSRKRLSEMALNQPQDFAILVEKIQNPWQSITS